MGGRYRRPRAIRPPPRDRAGGNAERLPCRGRAVLGDARVAHLRNDPALKLGLFDLVVIDEALAIRYLGPAGALARGRSCWWLAITKQVSPSAIGVPEEKIKELRDRFLVNQPFGSEMTPDKSIYDLAPRSLCGELRDAARTLPLRFPPSSNTPTASSTKATLSRCVCRTRNERPRSADDRRVCQRRLSGWGYKPG